MSRDFKRANFSITDRIDTILDEKASEWDMSRSEIVREAVREYTDEDRTARIEHKLDRVLDAVAEGGPHTSPEPTPKKETHANDDSTTPESLPASLLPTDTSSPTKNRANEMFNILIETASDEDGDSDVITEREIHEAIVDVWGEETDHMMNKYTEKIETRFKDAGFHQHVSKPHLWYLNERAYENHLRGRWEDVQDAILDGEPAVHWDVNEGLPAVRRALSEGRELKQAVLSAGVESEEEIEDLFERAQGKLDPNAGAAKSVEASDGENSDTEESIEGGELAFSILTMLEEAGGEIEQSVLEDELDMPFHSIFKTASELEEAGQLQRGSTDEGDRVWYLAES